MGQLELGIEDTTNTLSGMIKNLPKAFHCILGNITLPADNGAQLVKSTQEGTLLGLCDGSVIKKKNQTKEINKCTFNLA